MSLPNVSIVLVEDDDAQRIALAELLRDDGLHVQCAATGAAAVAAVAARAPDLLLSDFRIPDATGAEVIRAARRHAPRLPAIIVSGYPPDHPLLRAALVMRDVHYISKPVDLGRLRALISNALR